MAVIELIKYLEVYLYQCQIHWRKYIFVCSFKKWNEKYSNFFIETQRYTRLTIFMIIFKSILMTIKFGYEKLFYMTIYQHHHSRDFFVC